MTWVDWLFWPVAQADRWVRGQMDLPPGLDGVPSEFFFLSVMTLLMLALLAFGVFNLLSRVRSLLERVVRWAFRGRRLEEIERAATTFASCSSVLSWAGGRTGVIIAPTPEPSPRLPGQVKHRAGRWATRVALAAFKVPFGLLRFLWWWLRNPLGLYLLLGLLWVESRDNVMNLANEGLSWLGFLVSPAGLSVVALIVSALTLLLDHGLTARVRGRNAYQRDQAQRVEEVLARAASSAGSLVGHLEEALVEVVDTHEWRLCSAMEFAAGGQFRMVGGQLHQTSGLGRCRRMHSCGPEWAAAEPLRCLRGPGSEWDPAQKAVEDCVALTEVLNAGDVGFWEVFRRSPWGARALLVQFVSRRESGGRDERLPVGVRVLRRRTLEKQGEARIERFKRQANVNGFVTARSEFHEAEEASVGRVNAPDRMSGPDVACLPQLGDSDCLRTEVEECLDAIGRDAADQLERDVWYACLLRAEAERFVLAVEKWQRPRGLLSRIIGRAG